MSLTLPLSQCYSHQHSRRWNWKTLMNWFYSFIQQRLKLTGGIEEQGRHCSWGHRAYGFSGESDVSNVELRELHVVARYATR